MFPDVSKIEDEKSRPIKKGIDNRLRYTDGEKELVFPDLAEEAKALDAVKGIPRDVYDGLEDSQKLEVLNLGAKGDDIKGINDEHPSLKGHKIIAENIIRCYNENFT